MESLFEKPFAIYGIGTETERFLGEHGVEYSVVGLLDGFRESGRIYGYPIISLNDLMENGVRHILVIARPGSCRAIVRRIGGFCKDNSIELFDVRGKNLLETDDVEFVFGNIRGESRALLYKKIETAQIVSFDLFDTLVSRKVLTYTDIFELLDIRLKDNGIIIPDFPKIRLCAEKELSRICSPRLVDIYDFVLKEAGIDHVKAGDLAELEWDVDINTLIPREDVVAVYRQLLSEGKRTVITTDSYYSLSQIVSIFDRLRLDNPDKIFVSCEYGTSKTQSLFPLIGDLFKDSRILHIGDDVKADIEMADKCGFDTYHIFSGIDLFDGLGGLGMENEIKSLSDRVRVGMFISKIFNRPFWFEEADKSLSIKDSKCAGYLFFAPVVTDFLLWLNMAASQQGFEQLLFCARDGFLPEKLFRMLSAKMKTVYFLTSRIAAIRAGVRDNNDLDYVDSMKYSGTSEEAFKTRFGMSAEDVSSRNPQKEILLQSEHKSENYKKYIDKLGIKGSKIGLFDLVAKGTTQMFLQRLFPQHMKGFYFLQLEPEFMSDRCLDIEPFFCDDEKNTSAVYEYYYILETVLTAPFPQLEEFDEDGQPVFSEETRTNREIEVIECVQEGITVFFEDYLKLVPESARVINKELDEKMLSLLTHIHINDPNFMSLKVEDPFFGRTTDFKDLLR